MSPALYTETQDQAKIIILLALYSLDSHLQRSRIVFAKVLYHVLQKVGVKGEISGGTTGVVH